MARQPRLDLPGVPQHIVQRGNDRNACFAAPIDYGQYLQELREAAIRAPTKKDQKRGQVGAGFPSHACANQLRARIRLG